MHASVLRAPGEVTLEERPDPTPGPGEVLVRVASVGVCGSDVHYFHHGRIGRFVVERPLVLGHEPSGTVVALGGGVDGPAVGTRVSVEPGVPDRTCAQCRAGRYHLCPAMRFLGTPPVDGAFAELLLVPAVCAHPVPDALDDDEAALIEPLSVALWACHRGAVGPGTRVLVTGAGPVGQLAAQAARALGAASVTVTDLNPHRRRMAAELAGASVHDPASGDLDGVRFDVLLECSGNAAATLGALPLLDLAGRAVLVGMGADELAVPVPLLQERELTLTGTFRYAHTWPAAIALAASGRVRLDPLVTGRFGLDAVTEALSALDTRPESVKSVVRPGELGAALR